MMPELWVLYFIVLGDATKQPRNVIGGEYQSEYSCKDAARRLLPSANKWFGVNVRWKCELSKDKG